MPFSWQELLVICGAVAVGSLTKGLTGMGLPMFAIPTIASVLGVERAVLVMVLPTVVLNVWQSWANRECIADLPELKRLLLPAVPGAAVGASVLYLTPDRVLSTGLAIWVVIYLMLRILRPDMSLTMAQRYRFSPVVGFGSGAMQAASGICAPIIAPYIDALGLKPQSYVFAISTAFAAFAGSQFVVLLAAGVYSPHQMLESAIALIPGLIFLRPGTWLRNYVAPRVFTRIIRVLLVIMAVRLIYGAWLSG